VACIDEKRWSCMPISAPSWAMRPGQVLRRDCEYKCRGTANAFCGVEPKPGGHYPRVTCGPFFARVCRLSVEIAEHYPVADTSHLVMDNLSSHTRKAVGERYG
jgi:hypothetical protein